MEVFNWVAKRDGAKLFARTWNFSRPALPVVIVIHGLTMNSLVHVELCEFLASKGEWRVINVDVRGRGNSEWKGPYCIEAYTDDVMDLCENVLHVDKAAFIGTSMGGVREENFCFVVH